MGYELTIRRRSKDPKISKIEWTNYINLDDEFEIINEISDDIDSNKTLHISKPNAEFWMSKIGDVCFTFSDKSGWITVKNPSKLMINKMISIANQLDAVVLGSEGEEYHIQDLGSGGKKWWEFWK